MFTDCILYMQGVITQEQLAWKQTIVELRLHGHFALKTLTPPIPTLPLSHRHAASCTHTATGFTMYVAPMDHPVGWWLIWIIQQERGSPRGQGHSSQSGRGHHRGRGSAGFRDGASCSGYSRGRDIVTGEPVKYSKSRSFSPDSFGRQWADLQ